MDNQEFYQQPEAPVTAEATTAAKPGKGLAIASLVLGIAGIVLSCCWMGWLGIPGLIMGIISNKKCKSGLALAGIITSVVAILAFVVVLIFSIIGGVSFMSLASDSYY